MQVSTIFLIAQYFLAIHGYQKLDLNSQHEQLLHPVNETATTTTHNNISAPASLRLDILKSKRTSPARSRILNIFQSNEEVDPSQMSNIGDLLECASTVTWRDLGPLYYPRFLKEKSCHRRSRSCMGGYFRCIPVYYPVKVLSERAELDETDMMIPSGLRIRWKFTTIDTAVECICGV